MFPKTPILVLVGAGCIAAAGVGAYVAVRTGSTAASAVAPQMAVAESPAGPAPADTPRPAPAPADHLPSSRTDVASVSASNSGPTRTSESSTPTSVDQTPVRADASSAAQLPVDDAQAPAPEDAPVRDAVPPPAPAPPQVAVDELTVPANAVIGIRLDSEVSSETAHVEDKVTAHVIRDVTTDGRTAIRSGARLEGTVTVVQRGSKFKDRARIGVRFTTLILADNTRLPIQTDAIFRDGDAPGGEATSKIGGAALIGTILGSVIGGKKGAAIGSVAGAAGGTAYVANGDRNAAVIARDTSLTVRLTAPVTVLVPADQTDR